MAQRTSLEELNKRLAEAADCVFITQSPKTPEESVRFKAEFIKFLKQSGWTLRAWQKEIAKKRT